MSLRALSNETKLLLLLAWCGLLLGFRLLHYLPEQWASLLSPDTSPRPYVTLLFFAWNLFLALIPVLAARQLSRSSHDTIRIGYGLLWLLFLPNAPYLISDLEHLRPRADAPFVLDQVLFFSFALAGTYAGGLSVATVARALNWRNWSPLARLASLSLFPLVGFGVYLGREARWNSWNVFTHPLGLLEELALTLSNTAVHSEVLQYVLLYGGVMLLATLLATDQRPSEEGWNS